MIGHLEWNAVLNIFGELTELCSISTTNRYFAWILKVVEFQEILEISYYKFKNYDRIVHEVF